MVFKFLFLFSKLGKGTWGFSFSSWEFFLPNFSFSIWLLVSRQWLPFVIPCESCIACFFLLSFSSLWWLWLHLWPWWTWRLWWSLWTWCIWWSCSRLKRDWYENILVLCLGKLDFHLNLLRRMNNCYQGLNNSLFVVVVENIRKDQQKKISFSEIVFMLTWFLFSSRG